MDKNNNRKNKYRKNKYRKRINENKIKIKNQNTRRKKE
jgi:hypothetical protein